MITLTVNSSHKQFTLPDFRIINLVIFAVLITGNIVFPKQAFFSNNWVFVIYIFLVLPYICGHVFIDIFPYIRRLLQTPFWVNVPLLWVIGLYCVVLPGTLILFVDTDIRILFLFLILVLAIFMFGTPCRQHVLNIQDFKYKIYKHKNAFLWITFAAIGTIIFYTLWGINLGFTSLNPDNLQNMHLANLIKDTRQWSMTAFNLSPQYNQVDYLTVVVPLHVLGTYFFDYRYVMEFMFVFEMVLTSLVFLQRFFLFRYLKISSAHASILSALSVMFTFGGLYQVGSFYNQQILTHNLPVILYFTTERKFQWTLLVHAVLLPVHFTFSVFLAGYSASFFYFEAFHQMFRSHVRTWLVNLIKVFIVIGLFTMLVVESMFTFEVNYFVSILILSILTNPQYANTVGIFSNIEILQLLKQGLGPLIIACMLSAPLVWFAKHRSKATEWAIFIIIGHIGLFTIPIPVAARTIAFISIPICLTVYRLVYFLAQTKLLTNIGLSFIFVTYIIWCFTVRPMNLNISGDYINYPFLSNQYLDNLRIVANKITYEYNLKPEDYEIIAEFFSKHHLETMNKKYNDNGVYEENLPNRIAIHQMLSMERGDACLYWNSDYIVYFLNEKSYKWSRVPESLATNSVFSIWFSPQANLLEKAEIRDTKIYHTTGKVIEDSLLDDSHRFVLIKC